MFGGGCGVADTECGVACVCVCSRSNVGEEMVEFKGRRGKFRAGAFLDSLRSFDRVFFFFLSLWYSSTWHPRTPFSWPFLEINLVAHRCAQTACLVLYPPTSPLIFVENAKPLLPPPPRPFHFSSFFGRPRPPLPPHPLDPPLRRPCPLGVSFPAPPHSLRPCRSSTHLRATKWCWTPTCGS